MIPLILHLLFSFNGAWTAYPYLPSGIVLISGKEQGLVIVRVTNFPTSSPSMSSQPTNAPTTGAPTAAPMTEAPQSSQPTNAPTTDVPTAAPMTEAPQPCGKAKVTDPCGSPSDCCSDLCSGGKKSTRECLPNGGPTQPPAPTTPNPTPSPNTCGGNKAPCTSSADCCSSNCKGTQCKGGRLLRGVEN